MAITRSFNFLGEMRVDAPHLRSIESAINYDFDVFAGQMMTGRKSVIVKGFTLNINGTIGADPSILQMSVAGGIIMHFGASESGTIFAVADNVPVETLDSASNAHVSGGFTAGAINYIGLDLLRSADDTTADSAQFLDTNTLTEITETVDLARTLQYKIIISTQNFTVTSNILPIAKVVTNSSNGIASITDARPLMFRLGSGGDNTNALSTYNWGNRTENPVAFTGGLLDPFVAEDKNIGDLKSWIDAVMTSLWEVRGGEYWYSKSVRDNVKLIYTNNVLLSNADNFSFYVAQATVGGGGSLTRAGATVTVVTDANHGFLNGQNVYLEASADTTKFPLGLKGPITFINATSFSYPEAGAGGATAGSYKFNSVCWQGLKLLFENSAFTYNTIVDNNDSVGGLGILEDQCVYVDLVRSSNASVNAAIIPLTSVGTSVIPGRRFILAWRKNDQLFTRDRSYEAGRIFNTYATTTVTGIVQLSRNTLVTPPKVISIQGGTITPPNNTTALVIATAAGGANKGIDVTSTNGGDAIKATSTGVGLNVTADFGGVVAVSTSAPAILGTNSQPVGVGVQGAGGSNGGATGAGVVGISGTGGGGLPYTGQGVLGQGDTNVEGIRGVGNGTSAGVVGLADGIALPGGIDGYGIVGSGKNNKVGVLGNCGGTGYGVEGTVTNGVGIVGYATGTGQGVIGVGGGAAIPALGAETVGGAFVGGGVAPGILVAGSGGQPGVYSSVGGVAIPGSDNYLYITASESRSVLCTPDMINHNGTGAGNVTWAPGNGTAADAWTMRMDTGAKLDGSHIKLPKGAIIRGIQIAFNNPDGVAYAAATVDFYRIEKNGTGFTATNIMNASPLNISIASGAHWLDLTASLTGTVGNRTINDVGYVTFQIRMTGDSGANRSMSLYGVEILYDTTILRPLQ